MTRRVFTENYKLFGVVSHAFDKTCQVGNVSVYVKVPHFVEWIEEKASGVVMFSNNYDCGDGFKIPFHKKCDGVPNCDDGRDEINCRK